MSKYMVDQRAGCHIVGRLDGFMDMSSSSSLTALVTYQEGNLRYSGRS